MRTKGQDFYSSITLNETNPHKGIFQKRNDHSVALPFGPLYKLYNRMTIGNTELLN